MKARRILSWLLILASVGLVSVSIYYFWQDRVEQAEYSKSAKTDERMQELAGVRAQMATPSEPGAKVENLDWEAILSKNENVLAWIVVPGTRINYPIVKGANNSDYLNLDIEGNWDPLGSIFFDYRQAGDFSAYNTQIYGHYVDSSVPSPKFGELMNYYDVNFFNSHKEIMFYTPEKVYRGEVFGIHADSAKSKSNNININSEEELRQYVEFMKSESEVESTLDTSSIKKVVTLWSCALRDDFDSNGDHMNTDKSRSFISVAISELE